MKNSENKNNHIALFMGSFAGGGAERVMINLAGLFSRLRFRVDIVVAKNSGPLASSVPDNVRVIELNKKSWASTCLYMFRLPLVDWWTALQLAWTDCPSVFRRLKSFVDYLESNRPDVVLSTLDSVNIVALLAKYIANVNTIFCVRQTIFYSQHIIETDQNFDANIMPKLLKRWYPTADKVISVSKAMTEDLVNKGGLQSSKVFTIYNPIDMEKIEKCSSEDIEDSWFKNDKQPIVLAVGRLVKQKDFQSLLKAISIVRKNIDVKLVILGDGPERDNLENLSKELSLDDSVKLLGHVSNPYKYMANSTVFVLSSKWEGMPNVLLEALACKCSIVSTDCPSGPSEILEDGEYGELVPLNDVNVLAQAIIKSINSVTDRNKIMQRANDFALETIGNRYLNVLFES